MSCCNKGYYKTPFGPFCSICETEITQADADAIDKAKTSRYLKREYEMVIKSLKHNEIDKLRYNEIKSSYKYIGIYTKEKIYGTLNNIEAFIGNWRCNLLHDEKSGRYFYVEVVV